MSNDDFKLALVRYIYNKFGYEMTPDNSSPDKSPFDEIQDIFKNDKRTALSSVGQTRWYDEALYAFSNNKDSELSENDIKNYEEIYMNI